MKIRLDFVTNSSSPSFVCEVCGTTESGYDCNYSDMEMRCCVNGHTFCANETMKYSDVDALLSIFNDSIKLYSERKKQDQVDKFEKLKESVLGADKATILSLKEEYLDDLDDGEYPSIFCPLCTLDHIPNDTLIQWIAIKYEIDLLKERHAVRTRFENNQELLSYIRKHG